MSFSAATCITEVGPQPLGENIEIYSDVDDYTSLVSAVTLTQLTVNCPLILEVPDGSTKLKVFDPETTCFYIIQLQSNDMCDVCDLGFTSYNSSSISRLTVGDLTGSCDTVITDYLINWYVGGEMIFTSGKGTLFPYQQTHPMTGDSSIMVTEGLYTPEIQDVEINGFIFSKTGGTGHIPANLQCFDGQSVFVTGFTCDNGNSSDLPQYEHKISFVGKSGEGVIPPTASATYKLSADTKFFAWQFKAETVSDTIKFSLISSNYPVPIILDYWKIGGDASYSYNVTTFPKQFGTTGEFRKVITLTGMTISPGDYIQIDITPNPTNPQTNWTLYMDCLDDFDCDICNQQPGAYQISGATITGVTGTCDQINIQFKIIGECPPSNGYQTLDLYNYYQGSQLSDMYGDVFWVGTDWLYWASFYCSANYLINTTCAVCSPTRSDQPITYQKTVGNLTITTDSIDDMAHYYNNYLTSVAPHQTPFSGDNTNINFYRVFTLYYPTTTGNALCGDGTGSNGLRFHISSIVTTGQTVGGQYYINYTMPTITNGITITGCSSNCDVFSSIVSGVNQYSTGTTFNYLGTTNKGIKFQPPICQLYKIITGTTSDTSDTLSQYGQVINMFNGTYPASATTSPTPVYTVLYDYSGKTCPDSLMNANFSTWSSHPSTYNNSSHYIYYYQVYLTNPLERRDFKIMAYDITSNGATTGPLIMVYGFSGGTEYFRDPLYVI